MSLNLHLLRIFAEVAAQRSFTRAADALSVSQSAVSKGIKEFEGQLGVSLLERGPGGVRLTEAGAALMGHATQLFAAERGAEEELRALRGLARGELHIGASTTIAIYMLPAVLGAFQAAHPALSPLLTIANTRDIADHLMARDIDVALVEGPVETPGFVSRRWRVDELVVVAAPEHKLTRQPRVTLADLSRERLLIREPGSGTREVVMAALQTYGIRPAATLELASTEAIKQFVAAGLGIALVSLEAATDQIALGRLVRLTVGGLRVHRDLYRLSVAGRPPSPPVAAFDAFIAANITS